jgi:hypothetical protein
LNQRWFSVQGSRFRFVLGSAFLRAAFGVRNLELERTLNPEP